MLFTDKCLKQPICTCIFIFICILVVSLTSPFGILYGVTESCEKINVNIEVYPDDTVLAANLTDCHVSTSLTTNKTEPNVDVYVTNCSNVKTYSQYHFMNIPGINMTTEYTFIKQPYNYYVQGTIVNITTELKVSSGSGDNVFLCFFIDRNDYNKFITHTNRQLFKLLTQRPICFELGNTTIPFTVNTTGYYYVAIASLSSFDLIDANVSLVKKFYNQSDFEDDLVCTLPGHCSTDKISPSTCVFLQAQISDKNTFNYVTVIAKKRNFLQIPLTKIVFPVFVIADLLSIIIVLVLFIRCEQQRRSNYTPISQD